MPSSLATVLSLTSGFSPCPPVSVSVRAAITFSLEAFLGSWLQLIRYLLACSLCFTAWIPYADFPAYLLFCLPPHPVVGPSSLLRHSITLIAGTGISTSCPSTTLVSLVLGPDLPRADEPSPGNLRQSVCGILTHISLLTPAFSLPDAPILLTVYLQRCLERSPTTYTIVQIHRFGTTLSPG